MGESSARIVDHYRPEELVGRQVAAVVLVEPERPVPDGARLG